MAKGQKVMKSAKARNVRKATLKQKKGKKADGDADMTGGQRRETPGELFKRHAAEAKKLKAEIADLKRQRAKLPKKTSKEAKKALSAKIISLKEDLEKRHTAELAAAKIDKASTIFGGGAGADEQDSDDDESL
mmetsp:Transcript_5812/g.8240  ORF Transcript_5812/g.8240 Transcript_5812/m.8240 type:complete len:133 (+) Transcript_5812:137-535(+)|eukprot:CAMPEP_0206476702 /NCGR_PEP_ID=MMETSP0324_2-20121206/34883_1 /ASSEMBLY_ACC=CAM_ASM_000836 /TAXON_ID=2866 /ORGANISM="Crypthecodinium cohnii, Strain Seligo" /LENGTH=132 /DNA_ID=CAMNT_0053952403 /DNA_START=88 /DNA_END=486 /DNA_ORIENTATION=+